MLKAHDGFEEMTNPPPKRKSLRLASPQPMRQQPSCVQGDHNDACCAEDSRDDLYDEQHKYTYLFNPVHPLDRLTGILLRTSAPGRLSCQNREIRL